jgi:hypothetical protein
MLYIRLKPLVLKRFKYLPRILQRVKSVPTYSPTKVARTIRSITAKEEFKKHSEVKEKNGEGDSGVKDIM